MRVIVHVRLNGKEVMQIALVIFFINAVRVFALVHAPHVCDGIADVLHAGVYDGQPHRTV